MENPCKHCCKADAAQPVESFEPRCAEGCDDFAKYCNRAGKNLDRLIKACEVIVSRHS